jgi:hypothetical protein
MSLSQWWCEFRSRPEESEATTNSLLVESFRAAACMCSHDSTDRSLEG